MSEPFTFGEYVAIVSSLHWKMGLEVGWDTSFEQLEALRARMLAFVKDERRDFLPVFDVVVDSKL